MFPTQEIAAQIGAAQAATAEEYPYVPGSLFLGYVRDKHGVPVEIGIPTKRHAITIAGARSGKGVGVIIPNLLRWPHNALVIDPKREAAIATAEAREAMGQAVRIIDPFGSDQVPERFRARFNPLASLDPHSPTIREDINIITDGLVMRHDPRAAHWDGGASSLISGLIGHVVDRWPLEKRTLHEVRRLLTLPQTEFMQLLDDMSRNNACANLPASGAARLLRSGTESGHFLSNADENSKWLDSPPIAAVLRDSTFDLADLKTKPTTVYLVLPADQLGEHGRFLRLFVRAAINAMAKGGKDGRECLFLLDEFYSLGRIDEIAKASGLMPGYGVKLWPILQDINQLTALYGADGAGTFFGNADLHQFFGNVDRQSLEYVSHRMGAKRVEEVPLPPVAPEMMGGQSFVAAAASQSRDSATRGLGMAWGALSASFDQSINAMAQAEYQNAMNDYQRQMATVGKPRIAPDEVAALVQLKSDVVADGAICFAYGSENLYVHLAPYFRKLPRPPLTHRKPRKGWAEELFGKLTIIDTDNVDPAPLKSLGKPALWGVMGFLPAFAVGLIINAPFSTGIIGFFVGFLYKMPRKHKKGPWDNPEE